MFSPEPALSFLHTPLGRSFVREPEKITAAAATLPLTTMENNSKPEVEVSPENMSPFQSAKVRLDGLNRPGSNGGNTNHSTAGSWRRSTANGDINMGNPSDPFAKILDNFGGDHTIHVSSVCPGPVYPTKGQLQVAHGYAILLEDGSYTRLLRADELHGLNTGVPPTQKGSEGLLILPAPELLLPEHCVGTQQYVTPAFLRSLPSNRPNRLSPNAPPASKIEDPKVKVQVSSISIAAMSLRQLLKAGADTPQLESQTDIPQRAIDNIVANNPVGPVVSPSSATKTPRRQKIYCDKWIHEGVCAFTQLGCKYKHEMPMDKATQMTLGLNHGIPAWYKRAQSVQLRPESQASPLHANVAGPWRRVDGSSGPSCGVSLGRGMYSSPPTGSAFGQPNFGPIGRPAPPRYQQSAASNNPFSLLPQEGDMNMEDDEEDEVTWTGRRR